MNLDVKEVFRGERASSPLTTNEKSLTNVDNRSPISPNVGQIKPLYHSPIKLRSVHRSVKFMVKSVEQMKRFWGQCVYIERYASNDVLKNLGSFYFFISKPDNVASSNEIHTRRNTLGYRINGHGRYIVGSPFHKNRIPQSKIIIVNDILFDQGIYLIVSVLNPIELKNQGYLTLQLWSVIINP